MGVRRAVELACNEAERSDHVYTLGPLIHNPQVLEDLKRRGIEILDENALSSPNAALPQPYTIIIRAHGVGPHTEAALRKRGAAIIDATCPRVKASQLKAAAYAKAGYSLFLAGEETHAEVIGIRDYFTTGIHEPTCHVVGNAAEAKEAAAALQAQISDAKTALIGQTTISMEEYQAIGNAIARFFPNLEIAQTICAATRERQDSLRELLDMVDALIIVGGKDSANTRRLFAIAEKSGKPCVLVETAADIPPDFYNYAATGAIGLSAGASTPDAVIDAIEADVSLIFSRMA